MLACDFVIKIHVVLPKIGKMPVKAIILFLKKKITNFACLRDVLQQAT
jgi:hypothetical protein